MKKEWKKTKCLTCLRSLSPNQVGRRAERNGKFLPMNPDINSSLVQKSVTFVMKSTKNSSIFLPLYAFLCIATFTAVLIS